MRAHRLTAGPLAAGLLAFALGCGSSATVSTSGPTPPGGPPTAASGNAVYDQNCARCHALGAPAGGAPKGKGKGPDLSHVAADPAHDAAWIADHVRDPKKHKPTSNMPAFAGKLSDADIQNVSEFLATKK